MQLFNKLAGQTCAGKRCRAGGAVLMGFEESRGDVDTCASLEGLWPSVLLSCAFCWRCDLICNSPPARGRKCF